MKPAPRSRYLILTCDVEALPREARDHHVDRLIWGRFTNAPYEVGIGKMMDVVEEFGLKMVFFHDVLEQFAYGEETAQAARCIVERGHDLQLHMHTEFLPPEFWAGRGYQRVTWSMNLFNLEAARAIMECGVELFEAMAGAKPVAFRAGAFRYNASILQAMAEFQIPLSFQYYPATAAKADYPHGFDAGILPVFRWANGVIEVPLGAAEWPHPRGAMPRYAPFELNALSSINEAHERMNHFWENGPEFNVLVMLLHSWSFLARDAAGHLDRVDDANVRLFRDILAGLPADVKVITVKDLFKKISDQEIVPALQMPVQVAGTEQIPLGAAGDRPSPYQELVGRLQDLVPKYVPANARLIVVSKGDFLLANLGGRRTWDFPRDPAGGYAGYYPESGAEAVRHLEELRGMGGQYFLLPAFAFWWLDHYPALRCHLESNCRLVAEQSDTCRIYELPAS